MISMDFARAWITVSSKSFIKGVQLALNGFPTPIYRVGIGGFEY